MGRSQVTYIMLQSSNNNVQIAINNSVQSYEFHSVPLAMIQSRLDTVRDK